jgi:hypothetical protein
MVTTCKRWIAEFCASAAADLTFAVNSSAAFALAVMVASCVRRLLQLVVSDR